MKPSKEMLKAHHCLEPIDRVSKDPETTFFRRRTRLQQSLWRESKGLPIGSQPIRPKRDQKARQLGSRIDINFARKHYSNFLFDVTKDAVINRINNPQPKQTLYEDRLFADLLSSMPMCFNLFGPITKNLDITNKAIDHWWSDAPGKVSDVRFEWSPGRQVPGRFLENRSAFDVAFILDLPNGKKGLLGIETKYHEYCAKEAIPNEMRCNRYRSIASDASIFSSKSIESLLGSHLQQIWLDHLLALSMLQDSSTHWTWVKFVIVYPEKNPSFDKAAREYAGYLSDQSTFEYRTVESFFDSSVFSQQEKEDFQDRYIW